MNRNGFIETEKSLEMKIESEINKFIVKNSNMGYNRNQIIGCILSETFPFFNNQFHFKK